MNMWCHLPTGFNARRTMLFAASALLTVVITTSVIFAHIAQAAPGTNKTMNFQGRLLNAAGGTVPDGNYNLQFKIYQDGAGTTAGNPGGSLKWTESHINNGGASGVKVKNGYFSVSLGSITTFGTSIDWNQDTLWLSMNVAGSSAGCTTFGSAPCAGDGEMLPMKRLAATPFSINSGAVGGKTADDLVQLGQGAQTDAGTNSSIFINKTGSGNLVQLQSGGTDTFTINNAGNVTMGSVSNQSISVAASASGAGKSLTVTAGGASSGSGQAGGDLVLQGGAGATAPGGNIIVKANGQNSTGTFQVQNTNGDAVLKVDTASNIVSVGKLKFTPAIEGAMTAYHLWNDNDVTGGTYDDSGLNVGTVFRAEQAGVVTGVRFYSAASNTIGNANIGKLWSCSDANCANPGGSELANVRFASDSTEGWKTAYFSTPVSITPDTNYVVSFYIPSGKYRASPNYFQSSYTTGVLTAPASGASPNGVYYTGAPDFPFGTFNKTNYWVDVVFESESPAYDQISSESALIMRGDGGVTMGASTSATAVQGSVVSIDSASSINLQSNGENRLSVNDSNVVIGDGNATNAPTLLTLDSADSPAGSVLGSMYYDTTVGKVQCYEADGWGACSDAPDTFVSLTPEYSNAVMNGADIGTISSDICSDELNLNDGSSAQPTICGTGETQNFYKWTSTESTAQIRSIYVSYQLPSNFKEFVTGSTALMGRTNSSNSSVSFQMYRDSPTEGLISCGGTPVAVSTGVVTSWQTAAATGGADPSTCGFEAGDSILVRINLSARSNSNAYVSDLKFVYSNE